MSARTLRLPRKHAQDWLARYDGDDAQELATTARTITLELGPEALADLISDALYYAEQMDRANTGDHDYRPAARTCAAALGRAVAYTRRGYTITLEERPRCAVCGKAATQYLGNRALCWTHAEQERNA